MPVYPGAFARPLFVAIRQKTLLKTIDTFLKGAGK